MQLTHKFCALFFHLNLNKVGDNRITSFIFFFLLNLRVNCTWNILTMSDVNSRYLNFFVVAILVLKVAKVLHH